MTGRLAWLAPLGLAVTMWVTVGPVADARASGRAVPARTADPAEVAALGLQHARAHAQTGRRQAVSRARWARLTPPERRARLRSAARRTSALEGGLEARGRDDVGYWEPDLIPLPEYAIHASMLPTGKVLFFGREPLIDGRRYNRGSARLFDPLTGQTTHVPPPPIPENPGADGEPMPAAIYCAGQALLSDGTVLIVGGNLADPGPGRPRESGLKYTFLFDPWTETWTLGPQMARGRWYPTLAKLPSGDVIALSGYDERGQGAVNPYLDIYRPGSSPAAVPLTPYPGGTRGLNTGFDLPPDAKLPLSLYPGLFTLPDGNVALAGPAKSDSALLDVAVAEDPNAPVGSAWRQILGSKPSQFHFGGSTVLEPQTNSFAGSWRILVLGGADGSGSGTFPARGTVDVLTAGPGYPVWSHDRQDDLNVARFSPNTVLLPDGGLVTVGGGAGADYSTPSSPGNYDVDGGRPELSQVELRRPGEQTWRMGAAQQEFRTYHSVAALLPDGRVFSAGDDGNEGHPTAPVPPSVRRDSAELFWPPNLFDGDDCALRPVIRGVAAPGPPADPRAPAAVLTYGERFGIFTEHAQPGMRATLVAPAASTHSLDMNQRLVPLPVDVVAGGGLNATAPAAAALAPPGWYMLFVVDAAGTPSEARWIQLLAPAEAATAHGRLAPLSVTTAWLAPKGRQCVNPDGTQRREPDPPPPPIVPSPTPAGVTPTLAETSTPPGDPPTPAEVRGPAMMGVLRARIRPARRSLELVVPMSARASGPVVFEVRAADRRARITRTIDASRHRIRLRHAIPARLAAKRTGIVTISYAGNLQTRPQSLRLRVAAHPARLRTQRPTIDAVGRLRVSGSVNRRAVGSVRVALQFEAQGRVQTIRRLARLRHGRFALVAKLSDAEREAIAERAGSLSASVFYAGSRPAGVSGEQRAFEL